MSEDPSSRIAVVTGAGSGIGRAVTKTLLVHGWTVVAAGRQLAPLCETIDGLSNGAAIATDVADLSAVDRLFDTVEARFGRVDLLVNNAGRFGVTAPVDEYPPEVWADLVATNLTGAFLCARRAFAAMKRQNPSGGRIINNGSLSAHVPRPGAVAYTATKHAVSGLTKALSLEGRNFSIACGQIDVGNAATDMARSLERGVPQADGSLAVEPTIDVRHIAEAVLYMASLPLDANVEFMTVMATQMPFVGRG